MLVSMNTVRSIAEIDDFRNIAWDMSDLLTRPGNADIALEFPKTTSSYTGSIVDVVINLQKAQAECVSGVRQQFIAFAGEYAVGMSVIRFADDLPNGITLDGPNLSGFVCKPYRNRGIGRLSLIERLKVVDEQFDGRAWTKVGKTNEFSNRMVIHAGLDLVGEDAGHFVYSYTAS